MRIVACFKVSVICENCTGRSHLELAIPEGEDAPTTVDELVEHDAFSRMPFKCAQCEGSIASITNVRRTYLWDSAAA